MSRIFSNFLLFVVSTGICFAGAEGALRFLGEKPWEVSNHYGHVPVVTEPHPALGWVNKPGEYSYSVTANSDNIVRYTIAEDGRRKIEGDDAAGKPEIWIFGCSFSFGWALTDGEEYAARLSRMLPRYRVRNYSVPGYGTYQSLLRFEELAAQQKSTPIVVYGFASFHDERNVAGFEWLQNIRRFGRGQHWVRTPFAVLEGQGRLVRHEPVIFTVFPGSEHSAVMTEAQERWGKLIAGGRASQGRAVTLALIKEFSREAAEHGGRFIALGLSTPRDGDFYFRNLVSDGIEYLDASRYGALTPARMVPGDNLHPNGEIHRLWAERTAGYLNDDRPIRAANEARMRLYDTPFPETVSETIHGVVERRDREGGEAVIRGWVFEKTDSENLLAVSARLEGNELARAVVDGQRQDVVDVFKTDPFLRPGFEIRIPLDRLGSHSTAEIQIIAASQAGGSRRLVDLGR